VYAFTRKQAGGYRTLAVGVALVYIAITSAVSLMHSHDCPFSGRADAPETSFPSEDGCPACKFLAGSDSVEAPCDAAPVVAKVLFTIESAPDSVVVIANCCVGAIALRAPPASSLS